MNITSDAICEPVPREKWIFEDWFERWAWHLSDIACKDA